MRERPTSPHLGIYKPQITSVLSILHRITGVLLLLGAILASVLLGSIALGENTYLQFRGIFTTFIGCLLWMAIVAAMFYHLYNGIRHLFWDIGKGYSLENVTKSGIAVLVLSVVSALIYWFK